MSVAQQTFHHLVTAGLDDVDPDIAGLLGKELERQRGQIELIASENFTWPRCSRPLAPYRPTSTRRDIPASATTAAARSSMRSSSLRSTARRSSSAPTTPTCSRTRARPTNMAVYMAVLKPGDTILSLRLDHGGHLTHGLKVNFSGRLYTIAGYGVSRETMTVDYDEVLAAGEGTQAEADRVRRLRLSANRRDGQVPRDR